MAAGDRGSALAEWRRYGVVPVAAAVGYSVMGLQTYSIGPFVGPLEQEFGWTRAQMMMGLTISNLIGVLLNFAMGVLADRVGPRRVALTGLVLKSLAIALLATATASIVHWSLLWVFIGVSAALAQANVWVSAVAGRFDKGRGLAMAVTLSGSAFCAAIVPVLATWLIGAYGWRTAFAGTGLVWLLVTFPVVFLFYRGRQDERRETRDQPRAVAADLPGVTLREGLRMPAFWRLVIASFAFAFYTLAISPNLVPLLMEKGATALGAAQIASVVGLVGIVARISTGFLLDHLPANALGTFVFLVPVAGCALLLGDAPGTLVLTLAVASFGFTMGAEYDVVFYLVSRHFGLKSFAGIMGAMLTGGASGAAIAPVVTGRMHDVMGNYDGMLIVLMVLMGLSALAVATIGRAKREWDVDPGKEATA